MAVGSLGQLASWQKAGGEGELGKPRAAGQVRSGEGSGWRLQWTQVLVSSWGNGADWGAGALEPTEPGGNLGMAEHGGRGLVGAGVAASRGWVPEGSRGAPCLLARLWLMQEAARYLEMAAALDERRRCAGEGCRRSRAGTGLRSRPELGGEVGAVWATEGPARAAASTGSLGDGCATLVAREGSRGPRHGGAAGDRKLLWRRDGDPAGTEGAGSGLPCSGAASGLAPGPGGRDPSPVPQLTGLASRWGSCSSVPSRQSLPKPRARSSARMEGPAPSRSGSANRPAPTPKGASCCSAPGLEEATGSAPASAETSPATISPCRPQAAAPSSPARQPGTEGPWAPSKSKASSTMPVPLAASAAGGGERPMLGPAPARSPGVGGSLLSFGGRSPATSTSGGGGGIAAGESGLGSSRSVGSGSSVESEARG
uniref:Uncharacterized protein n=1 Tax=Pelodiscus sinensis TaxID=13735 RepID=K7EYI1_PELSI